ncbi:MAG: zf-HC2 domain-containing protein [Gemmatimonadota bacterium]
MKHPDPSRLSALLDGDLGPPEVREIERHMEGCATCSSLLADLRALQRQARDLPDRLPSRDLWPGIARALQEEGVRNPDVIRLHPAASAPLQPKRRGFHLSVPQAVAACLALAMFSGVVGARFGQGWASTREVSQERASQEARSSWVSLVREATPGLEATALEVARLERVLAGHRGELDPLTAGVLERSLGTIDRAIGESVSALRADPGNRFLENNLERAILAKGEYLRDAAFLVAPIS